MMLRYLTSTLVACALTTTVGVLAQEPQAPQPPKEDASKATLTGCVMQAKSTDGTPVYVLDKAEGGSATLYLLLGSSPSEMATNVNKKVEVTGPVRQPNAPPADDGAGSKDGAAANQKVLRPPMVQVESVKVVAESCK
jgi:hypothetical protein